MTNLNAGPPAGKTSSALWAWAPLGLGVLLLALGLSIWEPLPPGIWHDDGVYVLLGRSLADGEGLRYVGIPGSPLAPKFPPLYPLLLALVWVLFPTFPDNVPVLGGINLVAVSLAAMVFVFYVRKVLRIPPSFALALTALVWVSAHLWRVAAVPLSEPLFLLTLVGALWAGGKMESTKGPGPILLFLVAGGLAFYTRTLGVAVLAAGVVSLLLQGRKREGVGLGVGAVVLVAPWVLWTRRATQGIPETLQDILGSYGGWLTSQVVHEPGEFAFFLMRNAVHLLGRVFNLLLPGVTGPFLLFGVALLPVLLLGFLEAFRRSRVLAITMVLSFGILLVWPFQDIRLLVPFQPLIVLVLALGFWRLLFGVGLGKKLRIAVWSGAGAWVLLFFSVSVVRLAGGWTEEGYRVRAEALMDAARAVTEKTPPGAIVGAPELWSGIHLFTGRSVVPSARFRPLTGEGPPEGTPEEQYEIWIAAGVSHILVEHGGRVHGEALDRIDALCAPGTIELLDNQPGRYLVALNWDEGCQALVLGTQEGGEGGG